MSSNRWRAPRHGEHPTIYGRERERAELLGLLDDAAAGRGALVLVSGDAGIGKTALVDAFAHDATGCGYLVLTGCCYDDSVTSPYGLWSEILLDYGQLAEHLEPSVRISSPETEKGVSSQAGLFEELRRFFEALAGRQPLVLVLEDLQWSDPASLDVLRLLARRVGSSAILIVATYRDEALDRAAGLAELLPALVRESRAARIQLAGLDESAMYELIAAQTQGRRPLAGSAAAAVLRLAGGNPLFAIELLLSIQDTGAAESEELRVHPLSPVLNELIDQRLDRLNSATLAPLEAAAVIGHVVPYDLWESVVQLSPDQFSAALRDAIQQHVLVEHTDGRTLQFRHALVREALYRRLMIPERRCWHTLVAQRLIEQPRSISSAIANHFVRAEDPQAVEWLARSAENSWRVFAWKSASEQLEAAVKLLDDDDQRRQDAGWLCYRLASVLVYADVERSRTCLERAISIAVATGDRMLGAFSTFNLGGLLCAHGDLAGGLSRLEAGANRIDELTSQDVERAGPFRSDLAGGPLTDIASDGDQSSNFRWLERNPARGNLALWLASAGRFREARSVARQFLDDVLVFADEGILDRQLIESTGDACFGLGMGAVGLELPDEASAAFQRAREAYDSIGYASMAAYMAAAELIWVLIPFQADDLASRTQLREEVARLFDALDAEEDLDWSRRLLALQWPRFVEGDWDSFEPAPFRFWEWLGIDAAYCQVMRYRERPDLAWARINEALPDGPASRPGSQPILNPIQLSMVAAELALDAGEIGVAGDWLDGLDRWRQSSDGTQFRAETDLVRAGFLLLCGHDDEARSLVALTLEGARSPRRPLVLIAAHRLLGELDGRLNRYEEARAHFEQALALASDCNAPLESALALVGLASIQINAGNDNVAERLLNEAAALEKRLDAEMLARKIDSLLARIGSRGRTRLTPRQLEVLQLIAEGMTDRQIGEALGISHRTVMRHVTGILNTLGVDSRTAAAALAVRQGLIL